MKNKRKQNQIRSKRKGTIFSSKEDGLLLDAAKTASSKAVRSSIALGLTIKVIRNHQIIAINPDKTIKVLRNISKPTIDISSLKKEMILERK